MEDTLITAGAIFAAIAVLWVVERQLARRYRATRSRRLEQGRFWAQLLVSLVVLAGGLAVILSIGEEGDELRGQLIQFYGILLTATIALASTTLLGNALAGVMLRLLRGFRLGDVILAGDHFGIVTQRGLLTTEIQLEDSSDLTKLPNLYLATHPVTVTRRSGTVVSASVSLGYDVDRRLVERLLKRAAEQAGLSTPVVQVENLGDFSVTHRVLGKLEDIDYILTARSELRGQVLDALHEGGVEIVSPTFMNTRRLSAGDVMIPKAEEAERATRGIPEQEPEVRAEDVLFDKGQEARAVAEEKLSVSQEIEDIRARIKEEKDPEARERLEALLDAKRTEQEEVREREAELDDDA